jgi:hypothetical protein
VLHWHRSDGLSVAAVIKDGDSEGEPGVLVSPTPTPAPFPPRRYLQIEEVHYLQEGRWRPEETKIWYVVYEEREGGIHEVTRDLKESVARMYLPEEE